MSDRREFFRIDDDVIFDVHPVDADTAAHGTARDVVSEGPSWEVLESLTEIDTKTQAICANFTSKQATLARYLKLLNDKIDLLARHTVFSSYQHLPKTRISLSQDGIAFKNARMLYKGSFVVLRIIFLPRFTPVITFAQIIRCESRDNSYNVAAKFYRLDADQQQVITKTLIKAQQQA
ncbi:MAG TPA: PilZ domain-containing protein [Marinagarivorans sp.]